MLNYENLQVTLIGYTISCMERWMCVRVHAMDRRLWGSRWHGRRYPARFINVNKAIIAGGRCGSGYLVHTAGVESYLSRLPMASSMRLILHTSRWWKQAGLLARFDTDNRVRWTFWIDWSINQLIQKFVIAPAHLDLPK